MSTISDCREITVLVARYNFQVNKVQQQCSRKLNRLCPAVWSEARELAQTRNRYDIDRLIVMFSVVAGQSDRLWQVYETLDRIAGDNVSRLSQEMPIQVALDLCRHPLMRDATWHQIYTELDHRYIADQLAAIDGRIYVNVSSDSLIAWFEWNGLTAPVRGRSIVEAYIRALVMATAAVDAPLIRLVNFEERLESALADCYTKWPEVIK